MTLQAKTLAEEIHKIDLGIDNSAELATANMLRIAFDYQANVRAIGRFSEDYVKTITGEQFKSVMLTDSNRLEPPMQASINQKLLALIPIDRCVMLAPDIEQYQVKEPEEYLKRTQGLQGTWLEQSSDAVVKDFMAKWQFLTEKGLIHGLEAAMGGGVEGKPDIDVFPAPDTSQIKGSFGAIEPSFERSIYGRVSHIYEKYQLAKGMMIKAGLTDAEASNYLKEDIVWQDGGSVVPMGAGKSIADLINERVEAFELTGSPQSPSSEGIDTFSVANEVLDMIKGVESVEDQENNKVSPM